MKRYGIFLLFTTIITLQGMHNDPLKNYRINLCQCVNWNYKKLANTLFTAIAQNNKEVVENTITEYENFRSKTLFSEFVTDAGHWSWLTIKQEGLTNEDLTHMDLLYSIVGFAIARNNRNDLKILQLLVDKIPLESVEPFTKALTECFYRTQNNSKIIYDKKYFRAAEVVFLYHGLFPGKVLMYDEKQDHNCAKMLTIVDARQQQAEQIQNSDVLG